MTKAKLTMQNRILWGAVSLLALLAVSSVVSAYAGGAKVVVEGDYIEASTSLGGEGVLGASYTSEPTHLTYSDDWMAINSLYEYGDLEVDGTAYFDGDTRASSFVRTGSIATFTVTSTASAANVCDNPLWAVTPASSTPTLTLPATTTLFADCLISNGDFVDFSVKSVNTTTILALGAGGNADVNSTSTDLIITADKSFGLRLLRDSATTYLLQVDNYNN